MVCYWFVFSSTRKKDIHVSDVGQFYASATHGSTDVLLFAISTTCSTIVNIIQQINYMVNWEHLRVQQWEASIAAYNSPFLAFGPLSRGFNEILFWIVLYFYNVDAMLMLFWYE